MQRDLQCFPVTKKLLASSKVMPQGSLLGPLLSNIMLRELDRELEKWKVKYVLYIEDSSIYTKSKSTARKKGNAV